MLMLSRCAQTARCDRSGQIRRPQMKTCMAANAVQMRRQWERASGSGMDRRWCGGRSRSRAWQVGRRPQHQLRPLHAEEVSEADEEELHAAVFAPLPELARLWRVCGASVNRRRHNNVTTSQAWS